MSSINYIPFFKLHLMHNYFLGIGEENYDHRNVPDVFNSYDFQDFIKITPTEKTLKILKNHRIVTQVTSTGIIGLISVDDNLKPFIATTGVELQFMLHIKDPLFEKYTDIDATDNPIYDFQSKEDSGDRTLNILGTRIGFPISNFKIDYDVEKDSEYQQFLQTIGAKERVSLFGIVTISIDDLLGGDGKVYDNIKEYKIVFASKTSVWVYLDSEDNEVLRSNRELPFVRKGKISIEEGSDIYRMASPNDILENGEAKIYV